MHPGRLTQLIECHLDVVEVEGLSPPSPIIIYSKKSQKLRLLGFLFFLSSIDFTPQGKITAKKNIQSHRVMCHCQQTYKTDPSNLQLAFPLILSCVSMCSMLHFYLRDHFGHCNRSNATV